MPLHLLGKKSWNVYNQDNIDRVRRDEAAAQAAAQEAEKSKLEDEATDRLALLRGEATKDRGGHESPRLSGSKRKREDEWDRANRLAASEYQRQERGLRTSMNVAKDLIPTPAPQDSRFESHKAPKDSNTEPSFEQLSNMRMIDAGGRHKDNSAGPWYHSTGTRGGPDEAKDVWGNSDPNRALRDQQRISASDPLLAMKRGVKQLRELEKKRQAFRQERERDLVEVEEMARRREKHERRHRHRHRRHHNETERARHDQEPRASQRHRSPSARHKSPHRSDIDRGSSRKSQVHDNV